MKVTIRYAAQARQAAGTAAEEVELERPCSAAELLIGLAKSRGGPFAHLLLDDRGSMQPTLLLFLGDNQIAAGDQTPLANGDVITVLTPIAGGAPVTDAERAIYEWQLSVDGFGETGQEKLKGSTVLVSRCGGVGGMVAYELAAAGIGRLVLAHAGNLRASDLNRQLLMAHTGLGRPRVELAAERLRELNPFVEVQAVPDNVSDSNVAELVGGVDLVVVCAPLFEERLRLNTEAVAQGKPLVDCAMFELEAQVTTILPGQTPCLACLYPAPPPAWKRQFPVFGAVAGVAGCLGAMEAIKVLAGLGEPLLGKLLTCDLRDMSFRKATINRRPACPVCSKTI
jgi:molybdopterin/thiamine biosynthesis adenylyltransferase/molybdopterin converting factor small subunit